MIPEYTRRIAEQKALRKQPLTPESGPKAFAYALTPPRLIAASHPDFTPGLGDSRAPLQDRVPEDYKLRYPRIPAIRKVRLYHEERIKALPSGHWEGSFLTEKTPENITSKTEDLVAWPPRRYCYRWETTARRISTELDKDIRPAYAATEGHPEYWMTQIRYRPCFVEGYDWFAEYEGGVPVHCWYQGFTEAQLRIAHYTDYRRDCTIRLWEIANGRMTSETED